MKNLQDKFAHLLERQILLHEKWASEIIPAADKIKLELKNNLK